MRKPEVFDKELQELAEFARVISILPEWHFEVSGGNQKLYLGRYF
jgi:hypothetical protein